LTTVSTRSLVGPIRIIRRSTISINGIRYRRLTTYGNDWRIRGIAIILKIAIQRHYKFKRDVITSGII
jgi:hypothetical protein